MEKTAVKTFLWIDKCGDNGLFSNLLDIEYVIYDYIFSQKIQKLKFLSIIMIDISQNVDKNRAKLRKIPHFISKFD